MQDKCQACGKSGEIGRDICPMYHPKGEIKYWWVCCQCREKKQKQMMERSNENQKAKG